jgi:hypothetical protein
MDTRTTGGLPARLEGVRKRFEKWRRTRKVRSPIPETLWASAVKMAGMYGLHRTAKALRVNYYTLKKRVQREAAITTDASEGDEAATFIELTPSVASGSCECTLEWEDSGGAKMRVHLKGAATPDLAALSRSFWQSEP